MCGDNTEKIIRQSRDRQLNDLVINLKNAETDLACSETVAERNTRQKKVDHLLEEIDDFGKKNPSQFHKLWERDIHKINYKKAQISIPKVIKSFDHGSGAALFAIEEVHKYCGEYCLEHLRSSLYSFCGDPYSRVVTVNSVMPPQPEDLIRNLAEQLSVNLSGELSSDMYKLIDTLYGAITGKSVMLLEFHLDIISPDMSFLNWLVNDFWHHLVSQRSTKNAHNPKLKIIGVVKLGNKLPQQSPIVFRGKSQGLHPDCKMIPLPSEKWKKPEIQEWLEQFSGCSYQTSGFAAITEEVFLGSRGEPHIIKPKLIKFLERLSNSPKGERA